MHKKRYPVLIARDNTKTEYTILHKMAYTLLVRDNASTVSKFQFNVDLYSCR